MIYTQIKKGGKKGIFFKKLSLISSVLAFAILISGVCVSGNIPEQYYSYNGNISNYTGLPVSIKYDNIYDSGAGAYLLDTIPIKKVTINSEQVKTVRLGGNAIGIKMYCGGAIVVDLQEIQTENGKICPAKSAGIKKGDILKKINGVDISGNYDLISQVNNSNGNDVTLLYERDGKEREIILTPVKTNDRGDYKIGVWVRDSCAGIGTVTFYDPETKGFASLGHGVCDVDTGNIIPMSEGIPVYTCIDNVIKSTKGSIGCLQGHFINDIESGKVCANTDCGLYGIMDESANQNDEIEIASKNEVKTGYAQIYSTVNGQTPQYYDIEIESISQNPTSKTKNFVISINDDSLIEKTGGIVQGMSGSPIIQEGKLVGAVTHVFVNDPLKGYAIFADTMLEEMYTSINS